MPQERNKQLILDLTTNIIRSEAETEFNEILKTINDDEEVKKAYVHLLNEGYERLSTTEMNMGQCVWVINKAFSTLISEFKDYISLDFYDGEEIDATNIEQKIGQVVRYIDFIQCIRTFSKSDDFGDQKDVKILFKYAGPIKEYIFRYRPYKFPNNGDWADSFFRITEARGRDRAKKPGYEPFYIKGMIDFIKAMSDRERHEDGFVDRFKTFNFYNDPIQVISVYNLSIYAFLEFVESWGDIRPFIEEHSEELIYPPT